MTKKSVGGFFAVDRRVWHLVCGLGMNAAVAYLIMARGTGGDNRTTKWSTHAIETRTMISRSRAQNAIRVLEETGAIHRDPASKSSRPKYRLMPAHEIKNCEGFRPPLEEECRRVHEALGDGWTAVPLMATGRERHRWGSGSPRPIAERLVGLGFAKRSNDNRQFQAIRGSLEVASLPDWIWLPNTLVDGAAKEVTPVRLVWQTSNVLALRLLVNLYGAQLLDENGGVHFRSIREDYVRHKVGEQGSRVVWGFVPESTRVWPSSRFVAPHLIANDFETGIEEFWRCWEQLISLKLVGFVEHLVHADTDEGEIVHPVALTDAGLKIERELGRATEQAARAQITDGQAEWACKHGVVMLAGAPRHIEGFQMVGVARLRYRPRTSQTLAFMEQEANWQSLIDGYCDLMLLPRCQRRQSGQPEARNQVPGIAGQGLEQVPALLPRG